MKRAGFLSVVFIILFVLIHLPLPVEKDKVLSPGLKKGTSPVSWNTVAWADSGREKTDINWFKEQMKISPKYIERQEGILGLSWAHFFTMVFLIAFGAGTLIVFILRYRRTKELIKIIKEEKAYGPKD